MQCGTRNALQCNAQCNIQHCAELRTCPTGNCSISEINDVRKSYSWREKEKAANSSDDCYLNPSAQYLVELQTDLRIKSICLYCARNKQLRFIKLQNVSSDYGCSLDYRQIRKSLKAQWSDTTLHFFAFYFIAFCTVD